MCPWYLQEERKIRLFCLTGTSAAIDCEILSGFLESPCEAGKRAEKKRGGGGGGDSLVARLCHLTIDYASLSRRSTVPTPAVVETPPTFGR